MTPGPSASRWQPFPSANLRLSKLRLRVLTGNRRIWQPAKLFRFSLRSLDLLLFQFALEKPANLKKHRRSPQVFTMSHL